MAFWEVMEFIIGIRREDKNKWERRSPLTPNHIKFLKKNYNIKTIIQPSKIRVFSDKEYQKVGAIVKEDLSECPIIFAIKEIPLDFFQANKTYIFFSHTIKGQKQNMPMLKKLMDLNCNLIDYEKITDEKGRRLLFFGRYAGIAGMIDTLWAFGKRLAVQGIKTPFESIRQTIGYKNLEEVMENFQKIKNDIRQEGIPRSITPVIVGFAGYGNVSKGAQEIIDILPTKEIQPKDIKSIVEHPSQTCIYKVVFKEKHMVEPKSPTITFNLEDYYRNPARYRSVFQKYTSDLSILMNCIYWDARYPRLITNDFLKSRSTRELRLQVIGDISIDINGAIEFTRKVTTPDNPVFIYNPSTDSITDGVNGNGIVVMGIDNLPCELPAESSQNFGNTLLRFVLDIVKTDFSEDFNQNTLPQEIKRAVIVYHGKLTPDFQYVDRFL
jgi:alpha-aminoadipic semialdehyde synthase